MKNAIPIWTIFWKMPHFRRRKYSVKRDGVEGKPEGWGGGGGGRVLHNGLGLEAYTSHLLLSSQ